MLPLSLLRTAQGHAMFVELKNGETYNGHLVNCDSWMNINLRDVVCTSRDGERFFRLPSCYVRGNTIKYLCIPDQVVNLVQEDQQKPRDSKPWGRGGQRGGRGEYRGGGRGGRGDYHGDRGGRGGGGRGGGGRGGRGDSQRGRGDGRGGRGGSDRGGRGRGAK